MLKPLLLLAVALLSGCAAPPSPSLAAVSTSIGTVAERRDLERFFREAGTEGTLLVYDLRKDAAVVVNPRRAAIPYPPASTFKVLNSLVGLEVGAVRDVDSDIFKWDGRPLLVDGKSLLPKECDADIPLRIAFKFSCVPVYQELARRVGGAAYDRYLTATGYGNRERGGGPVDSFWLTGSLRITAEQQVAFLKRLVLEDLPFSRRTIAQVKDIMMVEKTPAYTLRAKTGYATAASPAIGWWVGWIEKGNDIRIFAMNMDIRQPGHLKARIEITKSALRKLGIL